MTRQRRALLLQWSAFVVGVALVALFLWRAVDWPKVTRLFFNGEVFRDQFPTMITEGLRNTIVYTLIGFGGGLVFGLIAALMRRSNVQPARMVALAYVDIMRSLPALLVILIVGFGLPLAFGKDLPSWANSSFAAGGFALALVAGAYLAETIRAGIEAVPKGQTEAARSLGMKAGQTTFTIVLPQAFRIIIPPLTNEFILLLKDSSLISVLGIVLGERELTTIGRQVSNSTGNYTPLIAAAVCYVALTLPLTFLVRVLERRANAGGR
jgi:polar amino acid transport system permease protein